MLSEIELITILLPSVLFLSLAFIAKMKDPLSVFIVFWLLFPNLATGVIGIFGVPMFTYLEIWCGLLLLIIASVVKQKNRFENKPEAISRHYLISEKSLVVLLFATLVIQYSWSTWVSSEVLVNPVKEFTAAILFKNIAPEFIGLIFFYTCYKLISKPHQIEKLLTIFAIFPGLLFLEYVYVLSNLPFSGTLKSFSINQWSNFNSLFLNDYNILGLVCGVGGLVSLYKIKLKGNGLWVLMFLISSFLVLLNLKRGAIVSYGLAALVLFYLGWFRHWKFKKKFLVITVFPSVCIFLVSFFSEDIIRNLVGSDYAVGRILNAASADSLGVRLGIQLKTLEALGSVWPLGFGNDLGQYFFLGQHEKVFNVFDSALVEGYYRSIASNTHNLYLEQLVSYGLLGGIFALATIIFVIHSLFRARFYFRSDTNESMFYALVVSLVVFIAIFYNFLAYPRVYVIVFLVIHAVAVVNNQVKRIKYA